MGLPTNEQTVATGADGLNDWQKVFQGPFINTQLGADGNWFSRPGFVHTITVGNDDTTKKTVNIYDATSGTSSPLANIVVPPGDSRTVILDVQVFNGLRAVAASWTSVLANATYR